MYFGDILTLSDVVCNIQSQRNSLRPRHRIRHAPQLRSTQYHLPKSRCSPHQKVIHLLRPRPLQFRWRQQPFQKKQIRWRKDRKEAHRSHQGEKRRPGNKLDCGTQSWAEAVSRGDQHCPGTSGGRHRYGLHLREKYNQKYLFGRQIVFSN